MVPSTSLEVWHNSYRNISLCATFNSSQPHSIVVLWKERYTVDASMLPSNIIIDFHIIFVLILLKRWCSKVVIKSKDYSSAKRMQKQSLRLRFTFCGWWNSLSSCLCFEIFFNSSCWLTIRLNSNLKKFHRSLWQRTYQPGNWQLFFYLYENTAIANLFLDSQFNFDSLWVGFCPHKTSINKTNLQSVT